MAILRYIECCASTGQREAGCLEAIKKFPDILVILDNRCSGTTIREAQSTASAMLDKLKDADGIFCSNEPSTLDMLLALKQNNLAGRKKSTWMGAIAPRWILNRRVGRRFVASDAPNKRLHRTFAATLAPAGEAQQAPEIEPAHYGVPTVKLQAGGNDST